MPGLYQRDNFAQQLAQAIELAQQRRERNQAIEDARREANVKAATDFAKALGRTYETWGDDEDKLAKLQQEREEAIAEQQQRDNELRSMFHQTEEPSYGESYKQAMLNKDMLGYVPNSKYTDAMANYRPTEAMYASRPDYDYIMKRRGLY